MPAYLNRNCVRVVTTLEVICNQPKCAELRATAAVLNQLAVHPSQGTKRTAVRKSVSFYYLEAAASCTRCPPCPARSGPLARAVPMVLTLKSCRQPLCCHHSTRFQVTAAGCASGAPDCRCQRRPPNSRPQALFLIFHQECQLQGRRRRHASPPHCNGTKRTHHVLSPAQTETCEHRRGS